MSNNYPFLQQAASPDLIAKLVKAGYCGQPCAMLLRPRALS
jgi:hypothetical protein